MRAIIAHDGGRAALGYLDLIDVEAITADPKPILGCSDISLLPLVLYGRTGLVGFHTDLATPGLGGHWQAASSARRAVLEKLCSRLLTSDEAIGPLPATPSWECWRAGRAEGRLIGGVINRIVLAQATPFALPLEWFDGAAASSTSLCSSNSPHISAGCCSGSMTQALPPSGLLQVRPVGAEEPLTGRPQGESARILHQGAPTQLSSGLLV